MCDSCKRMREYAATTTIPEKDWRVSKMTDRGAGTYYRFAIEGENLNMPPDAADRYFSWSVRDLDDPRYDLTAVS